MTLSGKGKTFVLAIDHPELKENRGVPFRSISEVYLSFRSTIVGNTSNICYILTGVVVAKAYIGDIIGFKVQADAGFIVDITPVA